MPRVAEINNKKRSGSETQIELMERRAGVLKVKRMN